MCQGVMQIKKMGRPTQDRKERRFEIRLSEQTYNNLENCSEKLQISKAEVIHKGIALVEETIKNRNSP